MNRFVFPAGILDEDIDERKDEDSRQERFLIFTIDNNFYGLNVRFVTGITGARPVTRVPGTPSFVKGIFNLRGKIVPVIDMRLIFGKNESQYSEKKCVILVEASSVNTGLVVDTVNDVSFVNDDLISPHLADGTGGFESYCIKGVIKAGDAIKTEGKDIFLLDAFRLLETEKTETIGDKNP